MALLQALLRVPFLTDAQVARTWFSETPQGLDNARKFTRRLAAQGILTHQTVLAHPEIPLPGPLWTWQPGEPAPPFGALAHACRSRYKEPVRTLRVWRLTAQTRSDLGGSGRPSHGGRDHTAGHDLHLAALYLRFLAEAPGRARSWVPESEIVGEPGDRVPDAVVQDTAGRRLGIEMGGTGTRPLRVEALFRRGLKYGLPWELW